MTTRLIATDPAPEPATPLTLRQLANLVGYPPDTIKRWERAGLIGTPARQDGRRVYTAAHLARIRTSILNRRSA